MYTQSNSNFFFFRTIVLVFTTGAVGRKYPSLGGENFGISRLYETTGKNRKIIFYYKNSG
jgi:hypothetical protein